MKYENIQQISNICDQIKKHQANLDLLNDETNVLVVVKNKATIFTIGTWNGSEHEYKKIAEHLVMDIKIDLNDRINNLKSMLETL